MNQIQLEDTIWPALSKVNTDALQLGSTIVTENRGQGFKMTLELDNYYFITNRSSFKLFTMLSYIGGFIFILTLLVNWFISFTAEPIHIAKLVEKLYKRTSPLVRTTLPEEIVKEDEEKDKKPSGESLFEKMDRKRKRLWNEALLREKMSFTSKDIVKASFANLIGATRHVSMLQKGI